MNPSQPKIAVFVFTLPKAFTGHIGVIQRNGLRSLANADGDPEVWMMGDEPGMAEAARELEIKHHPDLPRNEHGTPLLNGAFAIAAANAPATDRMYTNADLIYPPNFFQEMQRIQLPAFLAVGRRTNVKILNDLPAEELQPESSAWRAAVALGNLDVPHAMDFFFMHGTDRFSEIPAFAVGRPGWDSWMIYHALYHRLPVIDVTARIQVLHQRHDYNHVPLRRSGQWEGPEGDRNRALVGHRERLRFTVLDATHKLDENGKLNRNSHAIAREAKRLISIHPKLKLPIELVAFPALIGDRHRRKLEKRNR